MHFLFPERVRTHPQTNPWFIVSRTIVVHTCFLIILLGVEEVRRVPRVVALLDEHFTERYILDVLHHLTVKIGDIVRDTQMVGMIVELQLLIVIVRLEVAVDSSRLDHPRPCRIGRIVVAAEALAVHIVVVVLTIVRHTEVGIVVLDDLLLAVILRLIIHTDTVRLCACIRYASWVGTIAGKVA